MTPGGTPLHYSEIFLQYTAYVQISGLGLSVMIYSEWLMALFNIDISTTLATYDDALTFS